MLTISGLRIEGSRLTFTLDGGPADQVWFETQPEYASWLVGDRYDAAVVSLLPYAMKTGRAIKVLGGVTGQLLHALRTGIIPILREQVPSLSNVIIEADVLPAAPVPGRAVLTGLSCGVDSLSTIAVFKDHEAEELQITHVGFFNVGSHWGRGAHEAEVYAARLSRVRSAAAELALPLVEVSSNITGPFWAYSFAQHHTLWNCATAMALGNGVRTYLYSSAMPYGAISASPSVDCAYADPMLLPLLASNGVACISANAQMQRVEKTELIADWAFAQRWLDVCEDPGPDGSNCSMCVKCCRTLLTLEILNKLECFKDVFDLAKYEAGKAEYIAHTLRTRKTLFAREILNLASRRNFKVFKPQHRLLAGKHALIAFVIPYLPRWLKWRVRRLQGIW